MYLTFAFDGFDEYRRLVLRYVSQIFSLIVSFHWFAYVYYSFNRTFVTRKFPVCDITSNLGPSVVIVLVEQQRSRNTSYFVLLILTGVFGLCV
jgi:hypothetical protein